MQVIWKTLETHHAMSQWKPLTVAEVDSAKLSMSNNSQMTHSAAQCKHTNKRHPSADYNDSY